MQHEGEFFVHDQKITCKMTYEYNIDFLQQTNIKKCHDLPWDEDNNFFDVIRGIQIEYFKKKCSQMAQLANKKLEIILYLKKKKIE